MSTPLLTKNQRKQLKALAESDQPLAQRARLILLYDAGEQTKSVAGQVGLSSGRTRYWRLQFERQGMAMFDLSGDPAEADSTGKPVDQPAAEDAKKPQTLEYAELEPVKARPKPGKSPGVLADDPMSEAGRKVLHHHLLHMLANEDGTRLGEDIEALHDMRVATRRMRAAFEVFGEFYTPKSIRKHRRALRDTGRALGGVRDLDVFLDKAADYLKDQPEEERIGLQPLLDDWQAQRQIARVEMLEHLDSEDYRTFVEAFETFLTTPGKGAATPDAEPAPILTREIVPVLIYQRLGMVRAYASILGHANMEQLHALRIEFKRLRYTLEFFREILGPQAKTVIEAIKVMQDHLGDMHDAHLSYGLLQNFVSRWDESQTSLPLDQRGSPEAIIHYMAARHAEYNRLLKSFPAAWEHFNREELRQELAQAVAAL